MIWSNLARITTQNSKKTQFIFCNLYKNTVTSNNSIQLCARQMSNNFTIEASKWQWHKTKDMTHFYVMIAVIPLGIITFCANVFVGPATLTPIPEGYEPKHWEYYRHPITRFFARYVYATPQKDYEKVLAHVYYESKVIQLRKLEKKIWDLQAERQDYKYNYYQPYDMTATREFRELLKREKDQLDY